ncbi:PREDICTED: nucleolar protein 12-like [Rhagoletis zephyria]|uniref:nucleolar protein 12-like n=1 Tax=Rhagoletis zephyria TaxID=28612 RepID=UPI000811617F|nr:PREDICTED: nucleolar protein 12-like [Rhagoletis zephyria]
MIKNKKPEEKGKGCEKTVLEKSQNLKNNTKRRFEAKRRLKQVKNSDMAMKETGTLNGCTKTGDKKDKRTKGDAKQVILISGDKLLAKIEKEKDNDAQGEATEEIPTRGDKLLAKIDKKNAKKLAKKLKKQTKIEANKLGPRMEENESVGEPIEELSKPKIQKKKGDGPGKREPRDRDPAKEAATVFVGNLPVNTKRVQLVRLFRDYGPVNGIRFRTASGKVLFKHKHRKEAGTLNAWVVLKDAKTAASALDLNGTVFKKNHLRITRADLKSTSMDAKCTIFVGNLKYNANEEKLREIFSSCGDIDYVRCLHDDKGCKGVAYVCFKAPEAVGLALELNETMLDERPIHVERYSVRKLGAKTGRDAKSGDTKEPSGKCNKLKDKEKSLHTKDSDFKKKKFRGVKVDAMKKKQKKKPTSQMQNLAKKIAPKKQS